MQTELESLQNAANYFRNLEVRQYHAEDKRKTMKRYFLVINDGQKPATTISPVLDYEQLNHFILGMIKLHQLQRNNQPLTLRIPWSTKHLSKFPRANILSGIFGIFAYYPATTGFSPLHRMEPSFGRT